MTHPPKSVERSLETLIELYLLRCDVEGRSPRTVDAYRETLRRFLAVGRDEGFPEDVRQIEPSHLYIYLGRYTHHSPATRHRYFREVRCFFNWLVQAGYLDSTPFASLRNVRVPQKIVQPFSREDVVALLSACDVTTQVGLRDRAMLMVLLDTGIRCSELVRLDVADLDFPERRIRVLHTKGGKQRIVSFADQCAQALDTYLAVRAVEAGALFWSAHDRWLHPSVTLHPNGLKQMLRRLGKRTGIPKVHAHRFRHTFATWAIEQDAREPSSTAPSRSDRK